MQGLSHDIQKGLDVIIEGLEYELDVDLIEPDKIKSSMESKLESFRIAKELLLKWFSSPNRPSQAKFEIYVGKIINSGQSSLKTLSEALGAGIDYEALDTSKHKSAMQAKLVILKSINEMEASIAEMIVQLETGTINLKEAEFKRGYAEKFAYQEFYPESNYYKGYNQTEGVINIDPHSTKGEIFELDGLFVQIPEVPKNKKDILFWDKNKKDQCWEREPLPQGCTPDNAEPFADYILDQFKKRREGVWFYNNGEPTWLSPRHWFQLQWCKMMDDGIYPAYRDAQRKLFYHKEACYVDDMCMGQIFLKSRQTGYTYGMMSDSINMVTSRKNITTGLTSMTDEDARKAFGKMVYTFQELPFFFQPIVKGRSDSPNKLEFAKPSDASKESKKKKELTTDGYLNSYTDFQATKVKAYDGQHMKLYTGDECIFEDNKIVTINGLQKIKDVCVGDFVLCADGEYREVMKKITQESHLFKVIQSRGKDYMVNGKHKLYLQERYGAGAKKIRNVFITPLEYLEKPHYTRAKFRRVCFKGFDNRKDSYLYIDPYIYGVWLGDGSSKSSSFVINNEDIEIRKSIEEYAEKKGFTLKEVDNKMDSCYQLYMSDTEIRGNRFINKLREIGCWGNKHISKEYLGSSKKQMLEVIAGIIDTDGSKSVKGNTYSIEMSSKRLIEDIYTISKYCGLCTSEISSRERERKGKKTVSYRVGISDINSEIPIRVKRKKQDKISTCTQSNKMDIKYHGIGKFVGLTLKTNIDEEALMVLEDFTLTKNCAKWDRADYVEHLNTLLPTTYRGGRVVGKVFLGSTMGKLDSGGEAFKTLYLNSNVRERQPSGYTSTKLYSYFMGAHTNYEFCIDKYGKCWEETPPKGTLNIFGKEIKKGSIQAIKELYEDAKQQGEVALNAAYRAFPMTENHAMRDEAESCVFNLDKLTDQEDYNVGIAEHKRYVRGNFEWDNNIRFSKVVFFPDPRGRFKVAWMPSEIDGTLKLRNNVGERRGFYFPMNDFGCIGVDCYGSYTKGKNKQSRGAAHLYFRANNTGAPQHKFIFEYLDKPATQDVFNEDILKAAWFYGMPILAENNRRDFVRYTYLSQCRQFNMNRVDKKTSELSGDDEVLGGQPMTGQDILTSHENAIRTYIQQRVGIANDDESKKYRTEGQMGDMPFDETIRDWMKFDPSNRTAFDATISSGLAIMGTQRENYQPERKKTEPKKYVPLMRKYSNSNNIGSIITKR